MTAAYVAMAFVAGVICGLIFGDILDSAGSAPGDIKEWGDEPPIRELPQDVYGWGHYGPIKQNPSARANETLGRTHEPRNLAH